MNKSIYQVLKTFEADLKAAIKDDAKLWQPDQEQDTYHAQNVLEHVQYYLDFDPTGDTAEDFHTPCDWIPEEEG